MDGGGIIQSGEANLTRWLSYLPCRGKYARSKQRRLSRWLNNRRIKVHKLYMPLIRAALADWEESCLYLSLDTALFWDEYCLVRVAVVYRGRALPLAWRVLHHKSASVSFDAYRGMLHQAAAVCRAVKVIFLADRGFVQSELMRASLAPLAMALPHSARRRTPGYGEMARAGGSSRTSTRSG